MAHALHIGMRCRWALTAQPQLLYFFGRTLVRAFVDGGTWRPRSRSRRGVADRRQQASSLLGFDMPLGLMLSQTTLRCCGSNSLLLELGDFLEAVHESGLQADHQGNEADIDRTPTFFLRVGLVALHAVVLCELAVLFFNPGTAGYGCGC